MTNQTRSLLVRLNPIYRFRECRGFTLLEVLLALGLCAILAVVAVPSMEGWLAERRLRQQADGLIKAVQDARITAEKEAAAQVVVLAPEDEDAPANRPSVHYFLVSPDHKWTLRRLGGITEAGPLPAIHIDSRGYVDPVTFRVAKDDQYLEFRFDFLTGHAREEAFSF